MRMKFTLSLLLLLSSVMLHAQSKWASRVLEFLPAPGQFTNEKAYPAYAPGDDAAAMAAKATVIINNNALSGSTNNLSTISLGAYGGYVIAGFDHPVINKPYAYDLKVYGNWFDGNSEAGIVMVSKDVNGNGLADDPWYELAGSEYYHPETVHDYIISYGRPDPISGNVYWKDNQGKSGYVLRNQYHTQDSYYPDWFTEDTLRFRGTRLTANAWNTALPPQQYWRSESFAWGYSDNQSNTGELSNFDIDWAVDVNGNGVQLDKIDFIKVYTGLIQDVGWLGETSTEFSQAEDLHPDFHMPPVFYGDVHVVKQLPALTANTHQTGSGTFSFTDDTLTFYGSFDGSGLLNDGFTYSNETSSATGAYTSASGAGTRGAGDSYLVGYYNAAASGNTNRLVRFNDLLPHGLQGVYVNNTAATAAFFNRAGLQAGDSVKLVAKGLDASGNATGTRAEFKLADFGFVNSTMNYVVKEWCWMDLTALGSVYGVEFTLESSRATLLPASFCLDEPVSDILAVTVQPVGNGNGTPQLCSGTPWALTTAANGADITYQWYKDDVLLNDATHSSLAFTALAASDSGRYYCVMSNGKNTARSKEALLKITRSVRIVTDLPGTAVNVPIGTVVTMPLQVEGDNLTFAWYKNKSTTPGTYSIISPALVATASAAALVPAPYGFVADNNGAYFCKITGACGVRYSDTTQYTTVVNPNLPALAVTGTSHDTAICFGTTASLAVTAAGATSYAWQKQAATGAFAAVAASVSSGASNPQIALYNITAAGAYRCMVKQDAAILYSDTINVSVLQPLSFVQPSATLTHQGTYTALLNKSLNMEVAATGFVPAGYQWYYKSATDVDYVKLGGATNPLFTLAYVTADDAGKYRCEVTGSAGVSVMEFTLVVSSAISRAPVLYAYTNAAATAYAARTSGLFAPGESAFFNAATYAGKTFTCKWYKDGQEVIISAERQALADDSGIDSGFWRKAGSGYLPYLFIKKVNRNYAGSYILETTDADGTVERSSPLVIVADPLPPVITTEPVGREVNEDDTVALSVVADGKGFTPAYQWFHNGVALMGGTASPYVTTGPEKAAYTFRAKGTDTGSYYCVATTPGGSDTSVTVQVTVHGKVVITQHPADALVLEGDSVTLRVTVLGTGIGYQWLKYGLPVAGATSAALRIAAAVPGDAGAYSCVVKSSGLVDAESGVAYLAVINRPVITGNVLCAPVQATVLSVPAVIAFPQPRYQWYYNGAVITGATADWLTVSNVQDTGGWFCRIVNAANNGGSDTAQLVHGAPVITLQQADIQLEEGRADTLVTAATGDGIQYQWYKNDSALSGATGSSLVITGAAADNGIYYCMVSNACSQVKSRLIQVTVALLPPVIIQQPVSQQVLKGSGAWLAVKATGTALQYQWYKDGVLIAGATDSIYAVAVAALADSGRYTVVVTNASGAVTSAVAVLEVLNYRASDIVLFPNPATQYFTVKALAGNHVSVYNTSGLLVYAQTMTGNTLTVVTASWADGIYYVYVRNGKAHTTFKVIKQ